LVGIKQVIAIPFFLEEEAIGNLYVVSQRAKFSTREQEVLQALGQHAAISLRNAQLYRNSENLRESAQIFAKMAFSSAANVHALRNHIGAFRMYAQLIKSQLSESSQKMGESIMERLNQAADILDNLHEPWREQPDSQTDVNQCLRRAIDKIITDRHALETKEGITLHTALAENLPPLYTSPDMLTEAFRVVIKNAVEAIREKLRENDQGGNLWIKSRWVNNAAIEVLIRDDGTGIRPENLSKIFEIKWSTKEIGMGFGLFWTKDYIEGMGGSIKVESAWQEGASFNINLPASPNNK
jgi:signal transduction histidine kinase